VSTTAIYARKSTVHFATDDEAKSVTRQTANGKKFAATIGETVDDAHVYADDAISGAYWLKLVNRQRLLKAIDNRQIDTLIVRDKSRFSRRDGQDAVEELRAIAKKGVRIFFYGTGQQFTHGDLASDLVNTVEAYKNAQVRRDAATTVHEALTARAEAGYVASGKVFGYDNVRQKDGRNGHAEYVINEAEAKIVRRIFDMAAKGHGYHKIAKVLSTEGVPTIRPNASKSAGWSGASIRHILQRPMYRGLIIWNKTKKVDDSGKPVSVARPKSEWIQRHVPALRIVDESVWQAVKQQLAKRADSFDTSSRRPRADVDSQYMLTGFVKCACGSGMHVRKRRQADGTITYGYACTRFFAKGKGGCTNGNSWNMDGLNVEVLDAIKLVLTPDRIQRLLTKVRAAFDARKGGDVVNQLRADLAKTESKMARLTDAIEAGSGSVPMLADRLKAAEVERQRLSADLESASRKTGPTTSWTDIEKHVRQNLKTWQATLSGKPSATRDWFRQAVGSSIVCRPVVEGGKTSLTFSGTLVLSVLFGGRLVMDGQSTSSLSVDYTPAFQGVFRPSRRKAAA
jgi:DNA invertase Pin-like site-specific DNA recombinase